MDQVHPGEDNGIAGAVVGPPRLDDDERHIVSRGLLLVHIDDSPFTAQDIAREDRPVVDELLLAMEEHAPDGKERPKDGSHR